MDLIDKITSIIEGLGFKSAMFDLHFDNKGIIYGFVADESFYSKSDAELQNLIWGALKKRLDL